MRSIFALALTWRMILGAIAADCPLTDDNFLSDGCKKLKGLHVKTYDGTKLNDNNCGELLPMIEFANEPLFQYPSADSKKFYTIVFMDGQNKFLNMIKTNIPGSALKGKSGGCKIQGTELKEYNPPSKKFVTHPYDILLYEQGNGNFKGGDVGPRRPFDLEGWVKGEDICYIAGTEFKIAGHGPGLWPMRQARRDVKYC